MLRTLKDSPYQSLKTAHHKYVSTSIKTLDNAFNGLVSGTVTIITGRPGEGKSTFVHGIMLNAIDNRQKVLLVDGEHERNELLNMLFRKVIGSDRSLYDKIICNVKMRIEPKKQVLDMLTTWIGDKFITEMKYENDFMKFEEIFSLLNHACKAHNIDLVVFDNLMSLVDSTQAEMNTAQSKFMKQCSSLAKKANVAVILVAHPNGTAAKGEIIDYYQISGTADLPGLTDNVFQVIKDPTDKPEASGQVVALKNRYYGECPTVDLFYDKKTSSLCEMRLGSYEVKTYNWRMNGRQKELIE